VEELMQDSPRVLSWREPGAVQEIVRLLRQGSIVGLPTETLYGFSCLAHSEVGIRRVMQLKGITQRRGFVALAASADHVESFVSPAQERCALEFLRRVWPAPLTAVLRVRAALPWGESQAGVHTAAFRVPRQPELMALLRLLDEPLLSTSLNRTGAQPLSRPEEILQEFGAALDLLILTDDDAESSVRPAQKMAPLASSLGDFTVWPPRSLRAGEFDLQAALQAWEAV
jgi:L-threonylcarbamoyladenylate synthase